MVHRNPPRPRKQPQQSRSQILVDAIREACLLILHKEGPDQLSTQHIADVAGVNIASVYQYFPNKEAVLASVYDKELQSLADISAQRFADFQQLAERSLEETLRAIIDLEADQLFALYTLNPGFFTQYSHSFDVHERVDEITQAMQNPSWKDWLPSFLSAHQHRLRPVAIETLSLFTRTTLRGVMQGAVDEDPELLESEAFRLELLNLLSGYLVNTATAAVGRSGQ